MPRQVRIRFNADRIAAMLWEGTVIRATVVQNGLPRGAKLVGSFNEPPYVSLVFEHESLPDLAQDETAILCPVFADISVHERWRPDTMAERRSGMDRRTGTDRRRG